MADNTRDRMFLKLVRGSIDAGFAQFLQDLTFDTIAHHLINTVEPTDFDEKKEQWHQLRDLYIHAHATISRHFGDDTWPEVRYNIAREDT